MRWTERDKARLGEKERKKDFVRAEKERLGESAK